MGLGQFFKRSGKVLYNFFFKPPRAVKEMAGMFFIVASVACIAGIIIFIRGGGFNGAVLFCTITTSLTTGMGFLALGASYYWRTHPLEPIDDPHRQNVPAGFFSMNTEEFPIDEVTFITCNQDVSQVSFWTPADYVENETI